MNGGCMGNARDPDEHGAGTRSSLRALTSGDCLCLGQRPDRCAVVRVEQCCDPQKVASMSRRLTSGVALVGERADTNAIQYLRSNTCKVTPEQQALARLSSLRKLASTTPTLVAAAKLCDALASELCLAGPIPAADHQIGYLFDVARQVGVEGPKGPLTVLECEAWQRHLQFRRRLGALAALQLCRNDVVEHTDLSTQLMVSSVSQDGTVWMRGRCRAWPDRLEVVARATDNSARAATARTRALNAAVGRRTRSLSSEQHALLRPYQVLAQPTKSIVDELRGVVDAARDEKPIQVFLTAHPEILGCLMRGPFRYVRPQVRLNAKYVSDFLIMDDDSTGPRWMFIELESPRAAVTLGSSNELADKARHGKAQINDWRELVRQQLHSLNAPSAQGGSNLFGIRDDDEGLVLVGRRADLKTNHDTIRRQVHVAERVMIHTYDWLIDRAEQATTGNNFPIGGAVLPRPGDFDWSSLDDEGF
jgi:Domain of unknown function (DUF4263)